MDVAGWGRVKTFSPDLPPSGLSGSSKGGENLKYRGKGITQEGGPPSTEEGPSVKWEVFNGNRWCLEIRGAAPFEEWVWFEAEREEPEGKGAELCVGTDIFAN